MLFGFLPQNLWELSLALLHVCRTSDRSSIERTKPCSWSHCLFALCFGSHAWVSTRSCCQRRLSAVILRVMKGTAADILRDSLKASFKVGASYPCIFVFDKTFKDATG